jgi:hypothetical protein
MVRDFNTDKPDEPEDKYAPGPEQYVAHISVAVDATCIHEMELDGPPVNTEEDMLSIAASKTHKLTAEIEPRMDELEAVIMEAVSDEFDSVKVQVRPIIEGIELQRK